jgi:hypothetical protein
MRIALVSFVFLSACASVEHLRSAPLVGKPFETAAAPGPAAPGSAAATAPGSITSALTDPGFAALALDRRRVPAPREDDGVGIPDPTLAVLALDPRLVRAPRDDDGIGDSYTQLRVGAFDPRGDLKALDTGFWGDLAFGRRFVKLISVEASIGFFDIDGNNSEVYGIPILLNGRLGVPILILEPYVGVGAGGVWGHASTSGLGSDDSFAGMWNAFVGLEVGLGNFGLGLEYKYVQSADLDGPSGLGDYSLEGNVLSLVGKLPF